MSENEDTDGVMSEKSWVAEEDDGDEEEDVSVLSSLDSYQLCLKYQQVLLNAVINFCQISSQYWINIENTHNSCKSICGFFLSLQLQSKLQNRTAQLHHAREKVGHSAEIEISLNDCYSDFTSLPLHPRLEHCDPFNCVCDGSVWRY